MRLKSLALIISLILTTCSICTADETVAQELQGTQDVQAISQADELKEAEKPWSLETALTFNSHYIFRGQNLYNGPVFQPYVKFNYDDEDFGSLSATAWFSTIVEGREKFDDYFEEDFTLSYSKQLGDFSLSVGHFWYTYVRNIVNDYPSTKELFFSIAYDSILNPVVTFYHDYDEYDSQYYELGFSHSFETNIAGKEISISPFTTFGFGSNAKKYFDENGFEVASIGIPVEIPLGDLTLSPSINYSFKVDNSTVNKLWGGLSLTYSF